MPSLAQLEKTLASADDDGERLDALIALATALLHADTRSAAEVLAEAHTLAVTVDSRPHVAKSLHIVGLCSARLGRYDEARRAYAEARETFTAIGEPQGAAAVLTNTGIHWRRAREDA